MVCVMKQGSGVGRNSLEALEGRKGAGEREGERERERERGAEKREWGRPRGEAEKESVCEELYICVCPLKNRACLRVSALGLLL